MTTATAPDLSVTARNLADIEKDLRERLPANSIKTLQTGGQTSKFINWTTAKVMLDQYAPGWQLRVTSRGTLANPDRVFVELEVGIPTADFGWVYRGNIGYEMANAGTGEKGSSYGDPFSNAFAMAFKRSATLFGVAFDLYDKDNTHGGSANVAGGQPASNGSAASSGAAPSGNIHVVTMGKFKGLAITDEQIDLGWLKFMRDKADKLPAEFKPYYAAEIQRREGGGGAAPAQNQPTQSASPGAAAGTTIGSAEIKDLIEAGKTRGKAYKDLVTECSTLFGVADPKMLTIGQFGAWVLSLKLGKSLQDITALAGEHLSGFNGNLATISGDDIEMLTAILS